MLPIFLAYIWLEHVRILTAVQINVLGFDVFGGQMLLERKQLIKGKEKKAQL